MDTTQIPPKPDPDTGEPRPPSAPLEPGNKKPGHSSERGRGKMMPPPDGEGPMLEWFYPDRTTRVIGGTFISFLGIILYTWKDWGFGWVDEVWLWVLLLPWPFVGLWIGANRVSAGADWLINNKSFIKIYDLISVNVAVTAGGAAHELQLRDKHGNGMHVKIGDLQENHELWDLVYNGILNSVHLGQADTNKRARDYLQLDYPPTLLNT